MINCVNVILWVQSKTKLLVWKSLPRGCRKRSVIKDMETLIQEWMIRAFSTYPISTWLIWGLSSFHFCCLNKHPDQSNLRRGVILVYNPRRQQGVTVVRAQAAVHITSAVGSNESICSFLACFQIALFTLTRLLLKVGWNDCQSRRAHGHVRTPARSRKFACWDSLFGRLYAVASQYLKLIITASERLG